MTRSTFLRFSAATVPLLAALVIYACKDVTAPNTLSHGPHAHLSLNPVFETSGGTGVVQFTKVHIVIHAADGSVVVDEFVDFPDGVDQITVNVDVPLSPTAPPGGEDFSLNMEMVNAAGQVVYSGGPISVHATQGTPPAPVDIPTTYTGPGATAASVTVTPPTATIATGGTFDFTATAFDATNTALPGTPVQWSSLDPTIASFPTSTVGHAVAGSVRGVAHVVATLVTGQTATALLTVKPPAATIAAVSGSPQTGTVGLPLAQPFVVKVTAADGLGIDGVPVTFAVTSGAGTISTTTIPTDLQGLASTTLTFGALPGATVVSASAAGLSGSPVLFSALAAPGAATQLVFTVPPTNTISGVPLGPVTLQALDGFGNLATSFGSIVSIGLSGSPVGLTLTGPATATASSGVVTFNGLTLFGTTGNARLTATSAGLQATSGFFSVTAAPPTTITQVSGTGQTGVVGSTLAQPFVVKVTSATGVPVPNVTVAFTTSSGTLIPAAPTTDANGLASSSLTFGSSPTTVTVLATAAGLIGSPVSFTATSTAALASQLVFIQQPVNTVDGGAMPTFVVQARDAFGNLASNYTGSVSLVLNGPLGTLSVTGAAPVSAIGGVATFSGIKFSGTATGLSFVASGFGVANSATSNAFSITPQPASQLFLLTPPSQQKTGKLDHIVIQARNPQGNVDPTYTGTLLVSLSSAPAGGGFVPSGSLAFVAGVATFDLTFTVPGPYQIAFTAPALPQLLSASFTIINGAANGITVVSGNAQTALAGTALATPLVVLVVDGAGDPVPNVTVAWSAVAGGGSFTPATSITGIDGTASSSWHLGAGGGAQSAQASVTGVATPAAFTATATGGVGLRTWTGATSTAFNVATNWSPAGVPAPTDNLAIPVSTNNPVLSAPMTVANLTIAPTASLSILANNLTVTGNLDAGTTIIGGGGTVNLTGSGTLKGVINAPVIVTGTYTVNGATAITGNVQVSAGSLTTGTNTLGITGNFFTTGTGVLVMTNAASVVNVSGTTSFGGGASTLTAGTMNLAGDFSSGTVTSFTAGGTHTVVFNGTSAQGVTFAFPGSSAFQNATFSNAAGISMFSDATAFGNVSVTAGTVMSQVACTGTLLGIGGTLTDAVHGMLVSRIVFTGASPISASTTTLASAITFGGPAEVLSGNLTINGVVNVSGSLNTGGRALVVNSSFSTTGSGKLTMTSPADQLTVLGNATFAGGSTVGVLTNGQIILLGGFTQGNTPQAFAPSGAQVTVLSGSASQGVFFTNPDIGFAVGGAGGCATSCFNNLVINKTTGGVSFGSSVKVLGDFTETAFPGGQLSAGGLRLIVNGNLSVSAAAADMAVGLLSINGSDAGMAALQAAEHVFVDTAVFTGTIAQSIDFTPNYDLQILAGTYSLLAATAYFPGNTQVMGGTLLNTMSFEFGGDVTTSGTGKIDFASDAANAYVDGNVNLGGGSSAPSSGLLFVSGNFTASGATYDATGTHTLIMGGNGGTQTLTFTAPVPGHGVRYLGFDGCADKVVAAPSGMWVGADVNITDASNPVTGIGTTVHIGGSFTDDSFQIDMGGGWRVDFTDLYGSPTIYANFITTTLSISGGAAILAPSECCAIRTASVLATKLIAAHGKTLRKAPRAIRPVKASLTFASEFSAITQINGSVTIAGTAASLELNGDEMVVEGDLNVGTGGSLIMTNFNDYLTVTGNATFAGSTNLTYGYMEVYGDFTQTGSPTSFTANHGFVVAIGAESLGGCDCSIAPGMSGMFKATPMRFPPRPSSAALKRKTPATAKEIAAASQAKTLRQQFASEHAALRAKLDRRTPFLAARHITNDVRPLIRVMNPAAPHPAAGLRRGGIMASWLGTSMVQFDNPGGSASHFGDLYLQGEDITFTSDIDAEGDLQDGSDTYTVHGSNTALSTLGGTVSSVTFDNVRWAISDGHAVCFLDAISFVNMDPAVDQFTISRTGTGSSGGVWPLTNWVFGTTPSTGHYLNATDSDGSLPDALFIDMESPTPLLVTAAQISLSNGATTNWPISGTSTWVGNNSGNFDDPTNWSPVGVPGTGTDVFINSGTEYSPEIGGFESIHNLTLGANALLTIDAVSITMSGSLVLGAYAEIDGEVLGPPRLGSVRAPGLKPAKRGARILGRPNFASEDLSLGDITFTGAATISQGANAQLSANLFFDQTVQAVTNLAIDGCVYAEYTTGRLDVNGFHVSVGGDLETDTGGTLLMTNASGVLEVFGSADFEGGSTTGLLTDGQLIVHGDFSQYGTSDAPPPRAGLRAPGATVPAHASAKPAAMMAKARAAIDAATPRQRNSPRDVRLAADRAKQRAAHRPIRKPRTPAQVRAHGPTGSAPASLRMASLISGPEVGDSYAPSGNHVTEFLNGDADIYFDDDADSHFQNVVFDNGDWYLESDISAQGDALFAPSGSASLEDDDCGCGFTVAGVLTADVNASIETPGLTVYHNVVGTGFIAPSKLTLGAGGMFVLSLVTNPGLSPSEIDIFGDASLVSGETFGVLGGACVHGNGSLTINGATLQIVAGDFLTVDNGRLIMTNAADLMQVNGSLDFEGGTSVLTNGELYEAGSFYQGGASDAFSATGAHTLAIGGPSTIDFQFTNPGSTAGTSHFGNLEFDNPHFVYMYSPVFVNGVLSAQDNLGGITFNSPFMTMTVQGLNVNGGGLTPTHFDFEETPLVLNDGAAFTAFNNVTWGGFGLSYTGDVFTINRSDASTLTFNAANFSGISLGAGGHLVHNLGSATVHFATPNPGTNPGTGILASGTGTIIWP